MTNLSSSKEPLVTYAVYPEGITEIKIGGITKQVGFEDGLLMLKTCIPELVSHLSSEATLVQSTNFPRYLVKSTLSENNEMYLLLYAPSIRQTYRQKFRYTSESPLDSFVQFMEKLYEIAGKDKVVSVLKSKGITFGEDHTEWNCANYLFPNICAVLKLRPGETKGVYAFSDISYCMTFSNRDEVIAVKTGPFEAHKSYDMPFNNFFGGGGMCFGSINRPSIYNIAKDGYAQFDFFINILYRSYFNTDLPKTHSTVPSRSYALSTLIETLNTLFGVNVKEATEILTGCQSIYSVLNNIFYFTSPNAEYKA